MMFTSYILDKDALAWLWQLCGGDVSAIPSVISTDITLMSELQVTEKLKKVGFLHISGKRVDVERTIGFLITSMIQANEVIIDDDKVIFHCEKLIIAAESDRLSNRKCKLIPIKDKVMLAEYLAEKSDSEDDENECDNC